MDQRLPIDSCLDDLVAALGRTGRAVLQAPPGAGKTTRVPLAMLEAGLTSDRIIMLEPRRLATRAAAERLAESLGETPGETVGYRMRGDSKVSAKTRIEVVTEGILTRMIQSDPGLTGIGAILFDEFHERSLNADLGLALSLEIREALRPDLILLAMSATLDAAPVAALMGDAPVITSEGRAYPVETRFLDRPRPKTQRIEQATADLVAEAVAQTEGGVLVFLPGEGEIRRVEALLAGRLPDGCQLRPLYGALPFSAQRAAIAPVTSGRKIVLSTSIAETSLTIDDIRTVVDAGLARRARFDPGSGMSRLVTEKVSRAEATQRAGRAGRVAEGVCYKLWTRGEDGALPAFAPAEIEAADLTALALELALWGSTALPFLTPPPEAALAEAQALLHQLGALDGAGRITEHGRHLATLPLHPRLGHMLALSGPDAAPLAALLSERDILRGAPCDLGLRLRALAGRYDGPGEVNHAAKSRVAAEAKRIRNRAKGSEAAWSSAQMAALAYPDRIALRRKGEAPRYVLSGGKGAIMDETDPLATQRLLVVTDTDGNPREARIRMALPISEADLRAVHAPLVTQETLCAWSRREKRVLALEQERLGSVVLAQKPWRDAPPEEIARAMLEGIGELGLTFSPAADRLRDRVALLRAAGHDLPDMDADHLLATRADWLLPHITGLKTAAAWAGFDLLPALDAMLTWPQRQLLESEAPAHFTTPLGRKIPVDYSAQDPEISLRLQEMFGQSRHPKVAGRPLRITLLSPAGRPLQTTMDLPGFWQSSYADVRKDMRGRYPKHPWPEDPTQSDPTLRAKPRRR